MNDDSHPDKAVCQFDKNDGRNEKDVSEDCSFDAFHPSKSKQGCLEEAPFILCTSNPTEYISDLAQVNNLLLLYIYIYSINKYSMNGSKSKNMPFYGPGGVGVFCAQSVP